MQLSDVERNGLQVFRNYSKAFDKRRIGDVIREIDLLNIDMGPFQHVNELILREDPRIVTVVVCAFLDDQLRDMYRRELPDGIPGGAGELLNGLGRYLG